MVIVPAATIRDVRLIYYISLCITTDLSYLTLELAVIGILCIFLWYQPNQTKSELLSILLFMKTAWLSFGLLQKKTLATRLLQVKIVSCDSNTYALHHSIFLFGWSSSSCIFRNKWSCEIWSQTSRTTCSRHSIVSFAIWHGEGGGSGELRIDRKRTLSKCERMQNRCEGRVLSVSTLVIETLLYKYEQSINHSFLMTSRVIEVNSRNIRSEIWCHFQS